MTDMSIPDLSNIDVRMDGVLQKFHGDSTAPEDEFERVHISDGEITHIEKIENGVVVETTRVKEVA